MEDQIRRTNNTWFYLYFFIPLVSLCTFYFLENYKVVVAIFLILAFVCIYFDLKEMVKSGHEHTSQFGVDALGIVLFAPLYVYGRARRNGAGSLLISLLHWVMHIAT